MGNTNLSSRSKLFVGLVLLLFCAASMFAQTSRGIIAGTVSDNSGAVLSGATVTAKSLDTGETRTVTTGPTGGYRIESVTPGRYTVSVSQQGFKALTVNEVRVVASIITPVDAKLEVGRTETTVTVEASNAEIQTENGELSHNISTAEVSQIPIQNLNPISLVLTEPGVVDLSGGGGRNFSNGQGFSVNGMRSRSNNFLMDGQDNNDNSIQGQALQPSNPNAVEQVSILTNSYAAEFGRGGASVTNVIFKSGSNNFHGSLSELYEGSGLNALDPATKYAGSTDKARYDTHTYGFTIGGPIVKNKLFFFAASQWQRVYGNAQGGTILAPTAAGAAALQAYGSANANLLLQYYNGLTAPDAGESNTVLTAANGAQIAFAPTHRVVPEYNPDTQWNLKFDYNLTNSDTFNFRYIHDRNSYGPDFFNASTSLPGLDTFQGGPSENFGATYTKTFNPSVVNEFRASYGNFGFTFAPTAATMANPLYNLPSFTIAGLSPAPAFGVSSAFPQGRGHTTYQVQDALSITKGKHTWKMGADVARMLIKDSIPFNSRGTVAFTKSTGYSAFANFLDNFTGSSASAATKSFGNPVIRPKVMQQAFYLQDTWKLTSNLTLDYGIRYEFQNNPENTLPYPGINVATALTDDLSRPVRVNEDGNNWAPRFGLAYKPTFWKGLFGEDKTVIRLGYGMFYDSFFTNILDNTAAASPNAVVGLTGAPNSTTQPRGFDNALNLVNTVSPVLNPKSSVTTVDSNLRNPLYHQWNVNVQRELPGKFITTLAYVGTRGEHMFVNDQLNSYQGYDADFNYLSRINPNRGSIAVRDNGGDSVYHGFDVKVERQMSRGLLLRSSYTWGKAIDNGSEVFTITGGSSYRQNPGVGGRQQERGLAATDVRHRWVLAYVYNIPSVPKASNGFVNALSYITRDWQWSGTTSIQSGVPDTFYVGGYDTDGDGNAFNNRPFLGNAKAPLTNVGIDGVFAGGDPGVLYDNNALVTTGDLVAVSPDQVHFVVKPGIGNVGRNTYVGPGSVRFDMAFDRGIRMPWEGHALNFRAEFFNIFNHTNANGIVDTSVTDGPGSFLDMGYAKATTASGYGNRLIKLAVKYQF